MPTRVQLTCGLALPYELGGRGNNGRSKNASRRQVYYPCCKHRSLNALAEGAKNRAWTSVTYPGVYLQILKKAANALNIAEITNPQVLSQHNDHIEPYFEPAQSTSHPHSNLPRIHFSSLLFSQLFRMFSDESDYIRAIKI